MRFPPRRAAYEAAFWMLLVVLTAPVWRFPYFPSQDGPSHLYNSAIFLNYEKTPALRDAYTIQVPPAGNLTGHALSIALLRAGLEPETCEKVIVTLCLVGLAAAFRYALRSLGVAHAAAGAAVLPLIYNWPLQMGFWSFDLGVPLLVLCVGVCLRYQGRWTFRNLLALFVIVAAIYACHPLCWGMAALAAAVIAGAREASAWSSPRPNRPRADRVKQIVAPLVVFALFAIPNLLFAARNTHTEWAAQASLRERIWPVYALSALHLFDSDQRLLKLLFLAILCAVVVVLYLRIRRRHLESIDFLWLLSALFGGMGVFTPGRIGEGTYLQERFLLISMLILLLWLAAEAGRRGLAPMLGLFMSAMAIALLLVRIPAWADANSRIEEFVRTASIMRPESTVCYLDLDRHPGPVHVMEHPVDLLVDKSLIDVNNYEAARTAFWTRFRPGYYFDENYQRPASLTDFEGTLERFEKRTGDRLDYIAIYGVEPSPDRIRALLPSRWTDYSIVAISQPSRRTAIYRSKFCCRASRPRLGTPTAESGAIAPPPRYERLETASSSAPTIDRK